MIPNPLHNVLINFNNTISGGWNPSSKLKTPSLPQKIHRQSSQLTSPISPGNLAMNFSQANTRFTLDFNIPKIPTRVFPINTEKNKKNSSDPANKEANNTSQTLSQPNKSNFEKTKHISSTNYTTSTEAIYEPENKELNSKHDKYNKKIKEDFILNSPPKVSLAPTKEERRDASKNHTKKKIDEAKKQAEFFDDNKIKQYKFARADEDEEMNFRELCNAFQSFN